MFTACYDDRILLPSYFRVFLQKTLCHTKLQLISNAKYINDYNGKKIALKSFSDLIVKDFFSLPYYTQVVELFEQNFFNYSTNPRQFEFACFKRWFALNAATCELNENDYVCLLDSDFILGCKPEVILDECTKQECQSFDFIAEWSMPMVAVSPEITIIKKKALFNFCRFLITNYYSLANNPLLQGEYFDRVGAGLPGGICDMRALAYWIRETSVSSFNLNDLKSFGLIGNLNHFIRKNAHERDLALEIGPDRLMLLRPTGSKTLMGIHFQGTAKNLLKLVQCSSVESTILNSSNWRCEYQKNRSWRHILKSVFGSLIKNLLNTIRSAG
jgi:hypothetical protein